MTGWRTRSPSWPATPAPDRARWPVTVRGGRAHPRRPRSAAGRGDRDGARRAHRRQPLLRPGERAPARQRRRLGRHLPGIGGCPRRAAAPAGRLPPATVAVLHLAAVVGRDADVEVLVKAAGIDEPDVLDALEAGLVASLLTEPAPGGVRFVHALVRDTLTATCPSSGAPACTPASPPRWRCTTPSAPPSWLSGATRTRRPPTCSPRRSNAISGSPPPTIRPWYRSGEKCSTCSTSGPNTHRHARHPR